MFPAAAAVNHLHVRESGAGAPVVALHGSASSGAQWRSLVGCLEGRFRMIVPDLPGYGRSAAPMLGSAPSIAATVTCLAGLFEQTGPVHLVGHSFGAAVALKLALMRPEWVRSLSLIEPVAFHLLRNRDRADRRLLAEFERVGDTLQMFSCEGDPWIGMARFVDFWNGEGAWQRSSDRLRLAMAASVGQVLDDFLAIEGEKSKLADHARITCPTLMVMGLQSPAASMRITELLAGTIPGARLELVHDAGHMVPLTDPHVVDPMIRRHLLAIEDRRVGPQRRRAWPPMAKAA